MQLNPLYCKGRNKLDNFSNHAYKFWNSIDSQSNVFLKIAYIIVEISAKFSIL